MKRSHTTILITGTYRRREMFVRRIIESQYDAFYVSVLGFMHTVPKQKLNLFTRVVLSKYSVIIKGQIVFF